MGNVSFLRGPRTGYFGWPVKITKMCRQSSSARVEGWSVNCSRAACLWFGSANIGSRSIQIPASRIRATVNGRSGTDRQR
ncbi:unnamed protein product [Onchocerca flexuosa]|uniref:Uncharacterized protein n=1 Tax=Onchocerca flexuosa TaxID=387005 RepID=A0A183HQ86_9BILA|nr:unnamed protein product [Onchocerca flexuosa]